MILTNKHICAGKDQSTYVLTDYQGHRSEAHYLKSDPGADLCLLTTKAPIAAVKLAGDDAVKGQHISAIGAPHGVLPQFTDGFVSGRIWIAMADDDGSFEVHFWGQLTSVPIYHGSSGSPCFDDEGKVVGIFFAINTTYEHASMMVPVGLINRFLDTSQDAYER